MKWSICFLPVSILLILGCERGDDLNQLSHNSGKGGNVSPENVSGDNYSEFQENPFINVSEQKVSTFSVDADGGSYANVRRFIQEDGRKPPQGAVRTEELINYFNLDYEFDNSNHPIDLNGEVSTCPWNSGNKLIRIGIKGKPIPENDLPSSNYVFLIDVSGSMSSPDKLELLKRGFKLFVDGLDQDDKVAIVTYAGSSGVSLESTPGNKKSKIKDAIDGLGAGGSTAGAEGIRTAYEIAEKNLVKGGNNRVILGTDGDFNVGISSEEKLIKLIEEKKETGIFLTTLGVGRGNFNEAGMEQIANHGNGTYEYIDKVKQLKKVFIYEKNKFYTVAKDVKVQVEFNEAIVDSYRLIGYANRVLEEEDFEDDSKDAGEIGADQNITALYEIRPKSDANYKNSPTFTIDFRYKKPGEASSRPMELDIYDKGIRFTDASDFMQFTAGVASYSMLLTDSQYKGNSSYEDVLDWLEKAQLKDEHGLKAELRDVVRTTKNM